MKYLLLAMMIVLLALIGCTKDADKLTKVDINTLNVADEFNYETARPVDIFITGLYKQSVKISTQEGVLLTRGLVDPVYGLHTKVSLPFTVKKVVITYGSESATINVSNGNIIEHSFLPVN